jgi:hypothetical protein
MLIPPREDCVNMFVAIVGDERCAIVGRKPALKFTNHSGESVQTFPQAEKHLFYSLIRL